MSARTTLWRPDRLTTLVAGLVTAAALVACGGGDDGPTTPPPPPTIGVTAAPGTLTLTQGQSGTATVTLARGGNFTGAVSLAVAGAPNGVTATLSPTSLTGTTLTSTITVAAAANAAAGPATLTVTASGTGVTSQTATVALTVNAAAPTTQTLTVAKAGSGAGTVTSSPAGVDCGATCAAPFAAGSAVTLTAAAAAGSAFAGWSGACSGTAATCSVTMSAAQNVTATFNAAAPAGSFALAVAPASVSVQQGGTGSATVNVTRANGFTGAVALATSGAPNGLTVTPNPASATGGTATLDIAAGPSTATGTYTIAVTGTGTGVAQQTAMFTVQVTAPPSGGGGNVRFTFCAPDLPIWFAYQDGTGAWTRVTGSNNQYSFSVGARGGVAYVVQNGTEYDLTVVYGSAAELAGGGSAPCTTFPRGTKHLTGTVAGVGAGQGAIVSLGTAFAPVFGTTSFSLDSVPSGPLTLVASRFGLDLSSGDFTAADKIVLRRGVDYANNSAIPAIDFNAGDAFAPALANVTITNLGADTAMTGVGFSAGGVFGLGVFSLGTGGATQRYAGIPTAQLRSGDLQYLFASASPAGDETLTRAAYTFFTNVADRTVTLGPTISTPSVTSLGGAPYARLRAQLPSQSAYGKLATAMFSQTNRTATVSATSAYFGGTPGTWDLSIPDLSAAGFQATWAPQAGSRTDWDVSAYGGDFFQLITGAPTAGATSQFASKTGTLGSAVRAASRAGGAAGRVRRLGRAGAAMRATLK